MDKAPCRILHVVYSLDPGGMENGVVNMAGSLDPERFQIDVCCLERAGAFAGRLPAASRLSVLGKDPGFSWKTCRSLRREIQRIKPHLIHSHNLGPLIYSAIATLWGGTVPILHGEHAELSGEDLIPRRLRQRRWLYHCCRAVHSVSHGLHEQLTRLKLSPSKLRVVVNGVDAARFSPGNRHQVRGRLGIPEDALVLGIVGRFGPYKRHRLLIEVFESLANRHPGLHLMLVGGGGSEERSVNERCKASPHASRIWPVGFQDDPRPYYAALDLLVVPSLNEGLSNAVLEAMACGLPVLAHRACGNAEVISANQDGFLEDLSTADAMESVLRRAIESRRQFQQIGLAARQKVVEKFSLQNMARGYENLYHLSTRIPYVRESIPSASNSLSRH